MTERHNPGHAMKPTHCEPQHPVPVHEEHECHAEVQLVGKLEGMECCCPHLHSKTFVIQEGPKTEPQLLAFNQATFDAWENAGYLILSQSVVDTGAGWMLSFTVGWYAF